MRHPPHDFWRFSLRVYRDDGVEPACLALQDGCGADVNLLLFCGWMAGRGASLDRKRLRQAIACVRDWQSQVVTPLRQARRAHKRLAAAVSQAGADPAELRQRMLGLELDCEYIEQKLLADLAAEWPAPARTLPAAEAARKNLERYLGCLGKPARQDDEAHLAALEQAFGRGRPSR